MKTKLIIAILSFSTTFGFSAGISNLINPAAAPQAVLQTDSATARKITRLIMQDIQNGRQRGHTIRHIWEQNESDSRLSYLVQSADATVSYVNASQSIDDSNLPSEFQTAWRAHMKAWREHANRLIELKKAVSTNSRDAEKIFDADDFDTSEINQTWYEVLRVSAENDAQIPYDQAFLFD